jgi:aspartate carbamoyltransferase catalytic subunit
MYTDPNHIQVSDPGQVEGNTVFTYLDAFSSDEDFAEFLPDYKNLDELKDHYRRGGLGDVKVKKFLLNVINKELEPIRARRHEYEKDIPEVYNILKRGTEAAYAVAQDTLNDVKAAMKIDYFNDAELIKVQSEKYGGFSIMRHLLSPLDLSVDELARLLDLARDISKDPSKYGHVCDGKKIATLFYEPSTRTRLSFEAAMINLGGQVLGFSEASSSSASKGESVADTIRVISCYADICAMRHPKEGAPMVASEYSHIPIINAGDGGHQHPTQTLTDLMTIRELRGSLDNFTIGLCGDLKFGRTVHSLISSLVRYKNVKFVLISPKELRIPDYIRDDVLKANNCDFVEVENLEQAMPELDILYMTRVQRERFFSEDEYLRMKDFYILDEDKMALGKPDMYVLHPLPRVNEISVDVDNDDRAAYFKQVQFGVYVRMALILTLLGLDTAVNPSLAHVLDSLDA